MERRHALFLVLINLVWGSAPIVLKVSFDDLPTLFATAIRFALISLVLLPKTRIHKGRMGLVVAIGLTSGLLQFSLFFLGLAMAGDISPIAIAAQLNVPFATFLSAIFLGEVIRWRRWLGLGLAFGGGAVIAFDPRVMGYLPAFGLATLGAFMGAIAMILMRRLKGVGVFELQAWVAHLSWPAMLVLSVLFEHGQIEAAKEARMVAWFGIVYTASVSSLVAHAGFFAMLQRYEVSVIGPFLFLAPLFTVFLGVLFLGDLLTPVMVLGGVVTLSGVAIITWRERRVPPTRPLQ